MLRSLRNSGWSRDSREAAAAAPVIEQKTHAATGSLFAAFGGLIIGAMFRYSPPRAIPAYRANSIRYGCNIIRWKLVSHLIAMPIYIICSTLWARCNRYDHSTAMSMQSTYLTTFVGS